MMLPSAVMCGNKLKCWKTMPISVALASRRRVLGQLVQLVAVLAVADELAVDEQAARIDLLEVVDAAKERALARARRAEQADDLARADLEVDALEYLVSAEGLVHLLRFDHQAGHRAATVHADARDGDQWLSAAA